MNRIVSMCQVPQPVRPGTCETQLWGVPWSEDQFIEQMVKFGHPTTVKSGLPEVLQSTIEFYQATSLQERLQYRAPKLGFWLRRLVALKEPERALKSSMDSEVSQILKDKNLLLWEEMLRAVDYPDMGVVRELRDGTDLVGPVERTGLWPSKFQPALVTVTELHDIAVRERAGLQQQFSNQARNEFIVPVWEKTMDEVRAGLLDGPIALEHIPSDCPLSRRFGIQQGLKVRCMDDFSRSSVNSCVQTCESPKPHTIVVFAAMCVHLMSAVSQDEPWVGRTFALIGAYRQCAVKPTSKQYAYIIVQQPDTLELEGFCMKALPFGSVRSVHGFLRIAHRLWYVLVKEFKVFLTNHFDDFVAASPTSECSSIISCVHMYFNKLVGWAFSESGDKVPPFSAMFQALGVNIDVSTLHNGLVKLGNTENRCKELVEFLDLVLSRGYMSKQDALRLQGQLQFTSGNVFGRVAKCSLAAIPHHAYSSTSSKLTDDAVLALRLHRNLLSHGRPRELQPSSAEPWFIQTDACYDVGGNSVTAGVGAVLFTPAGKPILFFSQKLSDKMVSVLNPSGKQTAIFECEFFALFCVFLLWGDRVTSAVVIYKDNNGVRDSLTSCISRHGTAKKIFVATMALECTKQLTPWYARIPTDSNLSDGPSRFNCQKVLDMGAEECKLDPFASWEQLVALSENWGELQATEDPQL